MLIHQHEAAVGFEHDIETSDHTDQAQGDFEERIRLRTGGAVEKWVSE
jgi:hypothetical protein